MTSSCVVCFAPCPSGQSRCAAHKIRRGSTSAWRRTRAAVLAAHPFCAYCGAPADTVDHIVPLSRGGTDDPSNLRSACRACNTRKRDRPAPRVL